MKERVLVVLMSIIALGSCKRPGGARSGGGGELSSAVNVGPAKTPIREAAGPPCSPSAARVFFHAYTLSIPLRNGRIATQVSAATPLGRFAAQQQAQLGRDGTAIRCGRAVAYAFLLNGAQQGRDSVKMSDRIAEEWAGSVPPDIIGGAQRDVRSAGGETLALALELVWLADVLPDVAVGDYRSFNTTGTMNRRMLRQNAAMFEGLLGAGARNEMDRLMKVLGAQFEDQLVAVAVSMR